MPKLILVVEDNEDSRELLKLTFEHAGYKVAVAGDGEDGLERARERTPDLVMTDLNMPRMDGDEMARRMKEMPAMRGVPLVAVTGSGMFENAVFENGRLFDLVVLKPLGPEEAVRIACQMIG